MTDLDAIIVTGAGRGLGRAFALRAGREGAHVVCIARTRTAARTVEEVCAAGGHAEALELNLAALETTERTVADWIQHTTHRRLGVVLAAATLGQQGGLAEANLTRWAEVFQTNVLGNLAVVRALLPRMLEARYGRIAFVSGGGAAYAYPLFSAYALSKTAIVRAVENLAAELDGKGDFATVALAPGAMETEMLAQVRAAGAAVRTTVPIEEPVEFLWRFLHAPHPAFSGRFVHVRDTWRDYLEGAPLPNNWWLLRRIES
jgi:NAD(P)-dependent dehydrogenase (short-subunit alcohol dehydrogenase family)